MKIGNIDITREMMPSFSIGADYPSRQYSFMQDTLNGALNKQAQMQNPQNGVDVSQGTAQQSNAWGGQQ